MILLEKDSWTVVQQVACNIGHPMWMSVHVTAILFLISFSDNAPGKVATDGPCPWNISHMWKIRMEYHTHSSCLASPGYCGHLGSEPADEWSLSICFLFSLFVTLLFRQINTSLKMLMDALKTMDGFLNKYILITTSANIWNIHLSQGDFKRKGSVLFVEVGADRGALVALLYFH